MKFLLRLLFIYLPIVLVGGLIAIAFFGLEKEPAAVVTRAPTSVDADRAKAFSQKAIDRMLNATKDTTLDVKESDIDGLFALMNRGLPRLVGDAGISTGGLGVSMTLRLPQNPFRNYANLRFGLNPSNGGMEISEASLGQIRVPGPAAMAALRFGLDLAFGDDTGTRLLQSVRSIRFSKNSASLSIRPLPDLKERLVAFSNRLKNVRNEVALLGDRETIGLYYSRLVELEPLHRGRSRVSLAEILGPLFVLVRDRSGFSDPVSENQAALLALAIYFGDTRFEKLTGPVRTGILQGHRPDIGGVTLNGRHDLLLHFIISTGLKVVADQGIAMAIGEFKELLDSNEGGSGFSFVDLGADRTGLMFAEKGTGSEATARHLQDTLAGKVDERLFFPVFTDLPENMSAATFRSRFGGVDDVRYEAFVADIDRRISSTRGYAAK